MLTIRALYRSSHIYFRFACWFAWNLLSQVAEQEERAGPGESLWHGGKDHW